MKGNPKLTPEQFLRHIAEGRLETLYLFTGLIPEGAKKSGDDDRYAIEEYTLRQALRTLTHKGLDPVYRDFNLARFSALKTDCRDIVAAAQEHPIFSRRRIVLVFDLDKKWRASAEGASPAPSDAEQEALIEYLKHPCETTTVVFVVERLDRRLTVMTALLKACTVVEFRRLTEAEAQQWVQAYVRRCHCHMEEATAALLIGLVGTDLMILAHELDKLITYIGGQGVIARSDVEALVPHLREHSTFELEDLILARDRARAWRLLRRQLDAGEEPVKILGFIASIYRRMLQAKELMNRGASAAEVAKAVGKPPALAGRFNERVRHIPLEEIVAGIHRIAAVDDAIKSSRGTPEHQLEILLYELCTPQ
jgi:DNA polymerase-3 subunit delta